LAAWASAHACLSRHPLGGEPRKGFRRRDSAQLKAKVCDTAPHMGGERTGSVRRAKARQQRLPSIDDQGHGAPRSQTGGDTAEGHAATQHNGDRPPAHAQPIEKE